jgi:hypothetical protein
MQGFKFTPESDWGRSAALCYDLTNGKLLRFTEGPRGSALGDMAITADGDVIVSDSDGGGVYCLPTNGTVLERLDKGDFISLQTPAMHPDGKHVFVPDYVRGIAVLEIATKQVRWLSTRGRLALNGIDGLYFDLGRLTAVQNGTSPVRVAVFTLDATLTRIESEAIIERSTATLGDRTHGVVMTTSSNTSPTQDGTALMTTEILSQVENHLCHALCGYDFSRFDVSRTWGGSERRLADVFTFRNRKAIQMRTFADRHEALEWAGVKNSNEI